MRGRRLRELVQLGLARDYLVKGESSVVKKQKRHTVVNPVVPPVSSKSIGDERKISTQEIAQAVPSVVVPDVNHLLGKRVAVYHGCPNTMINALEAKGVAKVERVGPNGGGLSSLGVGEWDAVLVLAWKASRRAFGRVVDSSIMPVFVEKGERVGFSINRLGDRFGKLEESRRSGVVKN